MIACPKIARKIRWARCLGYVGLALCSVFLIAITTIRLVYTITPREDKSLFNGGPFYDPSVAELCLSATLTLPFSLAMAYIHLWKKQFNTISRNWFEITCNAILWTLWLGGTAASSAIWWDLNFCVQLVECRILQALLAFAWLGWICINALLFPSCYYIVKTGSWDEHAFDQWARMPAYVDNTSYREQRAGDEVKAIPWSYCPEHEEEEESKTETSYRISVYSGIVYWILWNETGAFSHVNTVSRARESGIVCIAHESKT